MKRPQLEHRGPQAFASAPIRLAIATTSQIVPMLPAKLSAKMPATWMRVSLLPE